MQDCTSAEGQLLQLLVLLWLMLTVLPQALADMGRWEVSCC